MKAHPLLLAAAAWSVTLLSPPGAQGQPYIYIQGLNSSVVYSFDAATVPLTTDVLPTVFAFYPAGGPGLTVGQNGLVYSTGNNSYVSIIDPSGSNPAIRFESYGAFGVSLTGCAPTADGSRIYLGTLGAPIVQVVDGHTGALLRQITIGTTGNAWGVALSPDNTRLFVTNDVAGTVSVVDTRSGELVATLKAGLDPRALVLSPDGAELYVANNSSASITVIDPATVTVIDTIATAPSPMGLAFHPDGKRAFVVCAVGTLQVVSRSARRVIQDISAGSDPYAVALSPDGERAYVVNYFAHEVSVLDLNRHLRLGSFSTGYLSPWSIAVAGPIPTRK